MVDVYAPLAGLDWQGGPPPAPGLWWVDRGPGEPGWGTSARMPARARYGVIAWRGPRATCRWVEPERWPVAVAARKPWPAGWRVASAATEPARRGSNGQLDDHLRRRQ